VIKKIYYLFVIAGLFAGCVSDNQIYMLHGEQKAFNKLGWKAPTAEQNSGAARSFMNFVKQIRDEEWEKADAFLLKGETIKPILSQHPCLSKGTVRVQDENPKMQTRNTILNIRCGRDKFTVRTTFHSELGWQFRFGHIGSDKKTEK